jgi:hypothetical protein
MRSRSVRCAIAEREHAGRGGHAERRAMMLCEVIGVEPDGVIGFDQPQAITVMVAELEIAAIEMIEDTEIDFHDRSRMNNGRVVPCEPIRPVPIEL